MSGWVRLWYDMPTDPKWRTVARKSGQSIGNVIAVFAFMLTRAGENSTDRGKLENFNAEDVASALDLDEADVCAIVDAMRGRVIDADNRLTGWEKRQPKREDGTAAERKAAWKERNGTQRNAGGTQGNAPEADTDADTEEEDNPPTPLKGDASDYPFIGKVARLNSKDYGAFKQRFHAIPDFDAALSAFDGWLLGQPDAKKSKWFNSCAPWLERRHQETLAHRARAGPVPVIGI